MTELVESDAAIKEITARHIRHGKYLPYGYNLAGKVSD
jgi:hypothetical protein